MIPVADLVGALPTVSVMLERYAAPSGIDAYGNPIVATPTSLTRTMVVHQATRKQLERAGLDFATDARAFYDREELRTVESSGQPDVVQYGGQRWELHNLADYFQIGGLYMALGLRIE